jgi:hypothetical protein
MNLVYHHRNVIILNYRIDARYENVFECDYKEDFTKKFKMMKGMKAI